MRPNRLVRHPLVVLPLVAVLLSVGWMEYVDGRGRLSLPEAGINLLTAAGATGEEMSGWRIDHRPDASVSLTAVPGQATESALRLEVSREGAGSVTLTSPRAEVVPRQTHLFKAYYTSDVPFALLVRHFYEDGTDRLTVLRDYSAVPDAWTTVGHAFDSADTVIAVEYVFRLTSTGTLDVDGAYVVPAEDVLIDPVPAATPNLIPNPTLAADGTGLPVPWSPFQYGRAEADFRHLSDSRGHYLETRIDRYVSGEAKWQYPPISVRPGQYLRFSATYRSDREVDVVAEYELADGGLSYDNLVTVPPMDDWTTVVEHAEVPVGATSILLTLISHGDGTTAVRDHVLTDVSRPGPPHWDRPLVSITFDDGWASSFDNGVPLLEEHGYRGTFYVNPAAIETPTFMTAEQLRALDEGGHDIALHSHEHVDLAAIGGDAVDHQLREGQDVLAQADLPSGHLAVPHGRSDAQVEWYARQYYESVRGTQWGINTRQNFDPYRLLAFYVDHLSKPEDIVYALDEARKRNGWLILIYHEVEMPQAATGRPSAVSREVFAHHLRLVRDSGIAVKPVAEAFAEVRHR